MILGALLLASALALAPQHETPNEPAVAVSPAAETTATPAESKGPAATESHAEGSTGEAHAGGDEGHGGPSEILMHHVTDQAEYHPFGLPIVFPGKHLFFMLVVMAVVIVAARLAIASYKDGAPRGIGSAVEVMVVYVRDEMAEKSIGHGEGEKYTPLLLSFFFFILFAALFGLLPFTATSTGNLSVTFALAFISFVAQQYAGISNYGVVGHFKNLVPHGLPAPLLLVMIPIEILGMFTKPFALMIRLFANMLAGHMMLTALLMLVALSYPVSAALGIVMIPISIGMALFIMCLEILVAFIQAYVFTLFSAIFIGMYAHPSH
ncbi:MAG: F0F1 ATP synthase subunit A [Vicinamibacteria bacterium]|nr:F0F1 ATP synthase subunit A [Vicinamibacteria bacterium]